jgi:tape measure domain-containing protein
MVVLESLEIVIDGRRARIGAQQFSEAARQITTEANRAGRNSETLGRKMRQAGRDGQAASRGVGDFVRKLRRFAGLVVGGVVTRGLINLSDGYTQLQNRLRLVTDSQTELLALQTRLGAISADTRTDLQANADLYLRLFNATRDLGTSQEDLLGLVTTLNQAFRIQGGTTQEVAAVLTQLGQGLASGQLAGDELRSVLEGSTAVARALADELGVGVGELRDLGAEGKITAQVVIDALGGAADSIEQDFARTNATIGESFSSLTSQVGRFIGTLEALDGTSIATIIEGLADVLDRESASRERAQAARATDRQQLEQLLRSEQELARIRSLGPASSGEEASKRIEREFLLVQQQRSALLGSITGLESAFEQNPRARPGRADPARSFDRGRLLLETLGFSGAAGGDIQLFELEPLLRSEFRRVDAIYSRLLEEFVDENTERVQSAAGREEFREEFNEFFRAPIRSAVDGLDGVVDEALDSARDSIRELDKGIEAIVRENDRGRRAAERILGRIQGRTAVNEAGGADSREGSIVAEQNRLADAVGRGSKIYREYAAQIASAQGALFDSKGTQEEVTKTTDELAFSYERLSEAQIRAENFGFDIAGALTDPLRDLPSLFDDLAGAAERAFSRISQAAFDAVVVDPLATAIQAFASSAFSGLFQSGPSTPGAAGAAAGGGIAGTVAGAAADGAFAGPTTTSGFRAFALGGIVGPRVVSEPTVVGLGAGGRMGAGLVGEAGDEIIAPAERGTDGRLGLNVRGLGGNSAPPVQNFHFYGVNDARGVRRAVRHMREDARITSNRG